MAKPGRNDPCHCGSGKKYKTCCQPKEEAAERGVIAKDQAVREERAEAHRLQQRAAKPSSEAKRPSSCAMMRRTWSRFSLAMGASLTTAERRAHAIAQRI